MPRRRYAIRLAYDGGAFRGFQRQPGLPTVQGALEDALASCGIVSPISVAARTDAGVHALAQVVGVATSDDIDPAALRAGLNRALPPEILCLEVERVSPRFHARASAVARRYVYLVGAPPPEGLASYAWALPDPRAAQLRNRWRLDLGALRQALRHAVGRHDFVGFARQGAQRDTVREIRSIEVVASERDPLVALVLEGTGFLRAMVRNLVGTAVTVGLGLEEPDVVAAILERRERYRGVRAPARGLTLVAVEYPPDRWGAAQGP